jgi:hypothetical protein
MGHNEDKYVFPAFGKWYYIGTIGDNVGPYDDYELALKEWKRFVRFMECRQTLWDRLTDWWNSGK